MSTQEQETTVCLSTWKTELCLTVRHPRSAALENWLASLLRDEVGDLDLLASRFRADSELAAVNRNGGAWTETSWAFVTVLSASLQAAQATGGLVDPLLGRQLVAAGYDRWAGQDSQVSPHASTARWEGIEIRPGRSAAQVRIPPDSALDLGAVAKGWLADRLAQVVHTSTSYDTVANMGGDLRVISPGEPSVVSADPELPGVPEDAMEVTDAGLATSGLGHRAWEGGHHIIDPRTGAPADTCWTSVSVLAAEAAGANTAATAGVILGDAGPAWIAAMGLDAWFVAGGPHAAREETVGRWPRIPRHEPTPA